MMVSTKKATAITAMTVSLATCILATSVSPALAGKVTLKYTTWGSAQEVKLNKDIIKAFQTQNPNIEVKLVHLDGGTYFETILTHMAAGTPPDVMYINPQWSFPLFKRGILRNLDSYFNSDKELLSPSLYYTKAYEGFTYDGKRFGTTNGTNVQAIYYNRNLVANAGLPEPKDDWSYLDFVEYAKKMTLGNPDKPTQVGFEGVPTWYGTFFPILWAWGGDFFDKPENPKKCTIDSKESIEALQFISDLYYKYRVAPSAITKAPGPWDSGKTAMSLGGTWGIEQVRLNKKIQWDIAKLPVGKTREIPFFLGGYVITKSTKHPNEAWQFAKFFQSKQAQELIARDGLITPMMKSVAVSDLFLKCPGAPISHRIRVDSLASARLADPLHAQFPKMVADVVYPNWDKMIANKQSPQATASKIVDGINKLLKLSK